MNYSRIVLICCMLFCLFGCCDDDITEKFKFPDCSFDSQPNDFTSEHCMDYELDSINFCERVVVDNSFELPEQYREWMPYHCLSIGSEIPYINELNEETILVVNKLERGIYSAGFNGFDNCDINDKRHRIYCVNREVMISELSSDLLVHDLVLKLEVEFNRPFELPLRTGAILNIRGNNIFHFMAFVEKGDLDNIQAENLIFEEEVTLLGETFSNVHTFKSVDQDNFVQIYYNKEYGIVGFKDYNEQLWRINN